MLDLIKQPWSWYFSGFMIALSMTLLIFFGKRFGISSTLKQACAIGGGKYFSNFFNYDWKHETWNLLFVLGAILGGFIASYWLSDDNYITISEKTTTEIQSLGIEFQAKGGKVEYAPKGLFGLSFNGKTFVFLILGGFLVGFGTRYAAGCTSGHAISGLSNLQLPSLIAVIGFFIGGLVMTHLIFPLIL